MKSTYYTSELSLPSLPSLPIDANNNLPFEDLSANVSNQPFELPTLENIREYFVNTWLPDISEIGPCICSRPDNSMYLIKVENNKSLVDISTMCPNMAAAAGYNNILMCTNNGQMCVRWQW